MLTTIATPLGGTFKAVVDVDDLKGIVVAYYAAFGNKDTSGDVFQQGSFEETIQTHFKEKNLVKVLWSHEFWNPAIGKPLEIEEDEIGLKATVQYSRTQRGKEVLQLYADEIINQHSVGVNVERDEEDRSLIIRVKRLWDLSPVNWGANMRTPTLSVKADVSGTLIHLRDHTARLSKHLDRANLSDEMGTLLTGQLQLTEAMLGLLEKALPERSDEPPKTEPDGEVLDLEWLNRELDTLIKSRGDRHEHA